MTHTLTTIPTTRKSLAAKRKERKHHRFLLWALPCLLVGMVVGGVLLRGTVAAGFIVEQRSMETTLESGDAVLANRLVTPERGDIVVMDAWNTGNTYVKRVIGLPGDHIAYKDGVLTLNGVETPEPYAEGEKDTYSVAVPEGMAWVLGDNRGVSSDSREHGFVALDKIVGVVYFRYWPLMDLGPLS